MTQRVKATHVGECQICGRTQKVPDGVLAKHGYNVRWGFFMGTCPGSGYEPYETSCGEIERVIRQIERANVDLAKAIADLDAEPEITEAGYYVARRKAYNVKGRPMQKVAIVDDGDGYVRISPISFRGDLGPGERFHSGSFAARDAAGVARYFRHSEQVETQSLVRRNVEHIEWLRKRVAEWKPRDLRPIEKEG